MARPSPLLRPIVAALHGDGRLRVWSVVITIFGDVAQLRGGRIAMADLVEITGAMDINPGALRTAMSRLSKEGWVKSHRRGRSSAYELSALGRQEFLAATERIYYPRPEAVPDDWVLAVTNPASAAERDGEARAIQAAGGLVVRSGVALWPAGRWKAATLDGALVLRGRLETVPDWVRTELCPDAMAGGFRRLIDLYDPVSRAFDRGESLDPLSALAVRILLIHDWRRLVLRRPPVPALLHVADWPGPACYDLVVRLYKKLQPASEAWWPDPLDPEMARRLASRFG